MSTSGQGSPERWYISVAGGGQTIAAFDTFVHLRFKSGSALPVMPLEEGSFITANKFQIPYDATIELAKAGDPGIIHEFMADLERYKNSVDLVDIVTPYYTFIHGNIYDIEYEFGVDTTGVGMACPSISIQEIRLVRSSVTSTQIPQAKNAENNTTVPNGRTTPRVSSARQDIGREVIPSSAK